MDLDAIAVFVKVVQAGGFSKAAKMLGMPNSTVSAKVSALEKHLGVTLLQRTTRRLRLTQAGETYYERSARALQELQGAENDLESARSEPQGRLRLTAPVEVGHAVVPDLVHRYLKAHPRIEVELIITNRVLDLVGEGIDLAIRAGELKDSGLIARRFELGHLGLWASPDYIEHRGGLRHPKELAEHDGLRFAQFKNHEIRLSNGKETAVIAFHGRVTADDFETLRALAILGRGIALLPTFLCDAEAKRNKLVSVLPQWRGDKVSLSLVYPAQRFVPGKVRAFIAVAEEFWKKRMD
jgi:DNA-binding transcriptional LysR family regulator